MGTFDFWTLMVYVLFFGLVFLGVRLALFLGRFTERIIAIMVKVRFFSGARSLLWLIDYDRSSYQKSRLIYWNRVSVRFSLLWGGMIFLAGFLAILKDGRAIPAVLPFWLLGVGLFLAYRWYSSTSTTSENEEEEDVMKLLDKLNPHVSPSKMVYTGTYGRSSIVRPWDYLDELFSSQ
ncbi:hypothetical protein ACFQ4C_29825 [Larkinella insperata]|uniref:Uncharacterized protein n=1 Tax=Larkinella insperata TaxID=332158 RepID=A0ABW3QFB1_9BACT